MDIFLFAVVASPRIFLPARFPFFSEYALLKFPSSWLWMACKLVVAPLRHPHYHRAVILISNDPAPLYPEMLVYFRRLFPSGGWIKVEYGIGDNPLLFVSSPRAWRWDSRWRIELRVRKVGLSRASIDTQTHPGGGEREAHLMCACGQMAAHNEVYHEMRLHEVLSSSPWKTALLSRCQRVAHWRDAEYSTSGSVRLSAPPRVPIVLPVLLCRIKHVCNPARIMITLHSSTHHPLAGNRD